MRLISSLIWAKKKIFVASAHAGYKRYARAKKNFFTRKYLFSVGYLRVESGRKNFYSTLFYGQFTYHLRVFRNHHRCQYRLNLENESFRQIWRLWLYEFCQCESHKCDTDFRLRNSRVCSFSFDRRAFWFSSWECEFTSSIRWFVDEINQTFYFLSSYKRFCRLVDNENFELNKYAIVLMTSSYMSFEIFLSFNIDRTLYIKVRLRRSVSSFCSDTYEAREFQFILCVIKWS
jgi:hypothetical protein